MARKRKRTKAKRAAPKKAMSKMNGAKSCCMPSGHDQIHYHIKKTGWSMLILAVLLAANYMYMWLPLDYLLAIVLGLFGLKKLFMRPYCCK